MKLLTQEQLESYENTKVCYIYKERFENKYLKDNKYCKVRDHCLYTEEYRSDARSISNLKYSELKKISVVFHNGLNYDYYVIIKELAEGRKKQFTCSGKCTEKYITVTVSIEKEVRRIDKNGEEITKNIYYMSQFIDDAIFVIIIFLKEFIELNVNFDILIKNMKIVELFISIATVFFNT